MARILIIEDHEGIREMMQARLERLGHVVSSTSAGHTAVETCRAHDIEIVITDIVMPDCEGLEIVQELRRCVPEVRVIAMSGALHAATYLAAAKAFGAFSTLAKPFNPDELNAAIAAAESRESGG